MLKLSWLLWLIAALLFFSGTKGAGGMVVLLVGAGFALSMFCIGKRLFSHRPDR